MSFALSHDDGQLSHEYDDADVILVGVSRTSKTPTCIYLANRGIKAANVPVVPGCPLPGELLAARRTLIVGLTKDPAQLVQIRRNRLNMLAHAEATDERKQVLVAVGVWPEKPCSHECRQRRLRADLHVDP